MIDFRYHVVSIVAVFLALALGLFLGSTSLQDQVRNNQKFDKALLPFAVSGRLSGQLVTVVSAPDASDGVRKQLETVLEAAGATVSLDVRLQTAFVDPTQDAFLVSLAQHVSIPGNPAANAPTGAARAAGQLAAVLAARPSSRALSPSTVTSVLSTYAAAKLLSVAKTTTSRPGTLAVVLAGPAPAVTADPNHVTAEQTLLLTFVRDLDATALGAVLAAPAPAPGSAPDVVSSAAGAGGLTRSASTVTGVEGPDGQIATVFALAAQAAGTSGQYGAPASHPLPSVSTSP